MYSATKNLSVRGYVLDLTNYNGVEKILTDSALIAREAKSFQNIIINGENLGVGKIVDLSFDEGNWVRTTEYQATIQILETVPLQNLTSSEFTGDNLLQLDDKHFNLLKSFSESFSLDFDEQTKILGGDHSLNIQYDADNKDINLISFAQSLATELLKTIPTSVGEGNYNTRTDYKVLNSENYDLIGGNCGFDRSFSYSTDNNSKPYSLSREHSISIGEDGIVNVEETCEIKGESDNPSLYLNSLEGLEEQTAGNSVYERCNVFFQSYKNKFNVLRDLNQNPLQKGVQINKFDGVINYDIKFSNDLRNANPDYLYEFSQTLDRADNGVWTTSENGAINGVGTAGNNGNKYSNAESAWGIIKTQIYARILNFYTEQASNQSGSGLNQISKQVTRARYNGQITYNYKSTDDPAIQDGTDDGIRKIDIEKTDTGLTPIIKDFTIPNQTYTLTQNANLKNQGTYTASVKIEVGCIDELFNGKVYFDKIKNNQSTYGVNFDSTTPGATDSYLEAVSYSCDEIEKTLSYQATYKYS